MAAAAHMDLVYQFMDATTKLALAQRLLLFVLPLVLLLHVASRSRRKQAKPLPPSPPGLPVLGHLLHVGARPPVSLRDLAARYDPGGGGLMLLRLGTVLSLVVSSPRAARAVLRTHDHAFASRPPSRIVDDLVYGSSNVGFAPYGEYWRRARKLVTVHLLTAKKVRSYRAARQEEAGLVVAKLREAAAAGAAVDVGGAVNAFANDIICRAVCGKFFREEGRNRLFRELNHMTTVLVAGFNVEDYFPGLASFLGVFTRFMSNKVSQTHQRWDRLLEEIISDHERRRIADHWSGAGGGGGGGGGGDDDDDDETDFIDVMLSVQEEYGITRDHIKAILMDMFEAGTATSSLVLEFAMIELMRNPHLMAKLQDEVRRNTPKGQEMVKEENLASIMAYIATLSPLVLIKRYTHVINSI